VRAEHQRIEKLYKVRNYYNRRGIRRCFNKWVKQAEVVCGLERGVNKTAKVELKHKMRSGFAKWRLNATAKRREDYIDKKRIWFLTQRQKLTKKDVWFSWLQFIRRYKLAKKFV